MEKRIIQVPEGISYLGDYEGIEDQFPKGSLFLDKVLCGCGATTMFLSDDTPTILCSARKELMYCKARSPQFKGKVYLFRDEDDTDDILTLQRRLGDYVKECQTSPFGYHPSAPFITTPKIITTYDSFKYVMGWLHNAGQLDRFRVVVDEAQTLFTDASFKGDVEIEFLENLKYCSQVIYLSATQFMQHYLEQIPHFASLPYVQIEWPRSAIEVTNITRKKYVWTPLKTAEAIIDRFKSTGSFAEKLIEGVPHYAKQAVFFVNDVSLIISIVRKCKLVQSEVNVICADNSINTKRLADVGLVVGHAPQKGEPHKTYTFATKCAFEGVDFYHGSAYTYIFSDATKENLALDISLVMKQCMGRQRLGANVFRLDATFFYKDGITYGESEYQEFRELVNQREEATRELIETFNSAPPSLKKCLAGMTRDCKKNVHSYATAIDNKANGQLELVFNTLSMYNEIRAWEVQSNQYQNGCFVMKAIDSSVPSLSDVNPEVAHLIDSMLSIRFEDQLAAYCTFLGQYPQHRPLLESLPQISLLVKQAYITIGPSALMAWNYDESRVKQSIGFTSPLECAVASRFTKGQFYQNSLVKEILQGVYNELGIMKTAVAKDLEKYIPCKSCKKTINDNPFLPSGRYDGYKIL